jgi:hypothetical protein
VLVTDALSEIAQHVDTPQEIGLAPARFPRMRSEMTKRCLVTRLIRVKFPRCGITTFNVWLAENMRAIIAAQAYTLQHLRLLLEQRT